MDQACFICEVKYPGPSHRNQSEWRESNPRRPVPKTGTLPLSYIPVTNIMPGDAATLPHKAEHTPRITLTPTVILKLVRLAQHAPFPPPVRGMRHAYHPLFV